eukprot:2527960-Amphidinium_carterae.1
MKQIQTNSDSWFLERMYLPTCGPVFASVLGCPEWTPSLCQAEYPSQHNLFDPKCPVGRQPAQLPSQSQM